MKTKCERVFYFPYEYKVFQEHFQKRALQGWKLQALYDHNYFITLKYVQCDPQKYYYYTDFCAEGSYFIFGEGSVKSKEYTQFLESYGYLFVAGARGLMVYESEQEISFELREENEETTKQLRKASYYSTIYPFMMLVLSILGFVSSIRNLFLYPSGYTLSENRTLMSFVQYSAMTFLFASMIFPVFWWRFTGRITTSIRRIRLRFHLVLVGLSLWLFLPFVSEYVDSLWIFIVLLIPFIMLLYVWDHMKTHTARTITSWVAIGFFIVSLGLLMANASSKLDQDSITKNIFSAEDFKLFGVEQEIYAQSSVLIDYEESTFYVSNDSEMVDYMDESSDEKYAYYEFVYVKDTLLHDFLLSRLPYEGSMQPSITKRGSMTLYTSSKAVYIRDGSFIIRMNPTLYHQVKDMDFEALFEKAKEVYMYM